MSFFSSQNKTQTSSSATSDTSYHSQDTNSRNTDASTNLENSSQLNAAYDSHNSVTAGAGSTITSSEDPGIIANALETVKSIALGFANAAGMGHGGGASGGDGHYDPQASASKIPTAVYVVGGVVGLLVVAAVIIAVTRKK